MWFIMSEFWQQRFWKSWRRLKRFCEILIIMNYSSSAWRGPMMKQLFKHQCLTKLSKWATDETPAPRDRFEVCVSAWMWGVFMLKNCSSLMLLLFRLPPGHNSISQWPSTLQRPTVGQRSIALHVGNRVISSFPLSPFLIHTLITVCLYLMFTCIIHTWSWGWA